MANTKTGTKSNSKKTTKVNKEEVNEEILAEEPVITKQVITETVKEENEEVILLKQQIEELKKAMAQLVNVQPVVQQKQVGDEEEVVIGCRVIQGIGWGDPSDSAGEIRLRFGEEQSVTISDMKKYFRLASVRRLFVNGLCYFANPKDYDIFKIKNYIDLSSENLNNVLNDKDINTIITKLDKITDNKKNSSIVNCMIFRICDMIMNRELSWDYYVRKAIEDYFDFQFDRGINILRQLKELKK